MPTPDVSLDLTGVPCPRNSARALLKLETMDTGERLEITIDDGEPIANVPGSLTDEGHTIESTTQLPDGRWVLLIVAR